MACKSRIEYEGAFYHVITRGNQKERIFREISDFRKYLSLLAAYKQRYHFRLYAYILMSSHVHEGQRFSWGGKSSASWPRNTGTQGER